MAARQRHHAGAPESHRTRADKLINLVDMQEYAGFPLCLFLSRLHEIGERIKPVRSSNLAGPGIEESVHDLVLAVEVECNRLELKPGAFIGRDLREQLDAGAPLAKIAEGLGYLQRAIDEDLRERLFLYLPEADLKLYQEPLCYFPKAKEVFLRARLDMIGAYRCHVLGQPTACVFHCMGILQEGLHSLARHVDVQFERKPIELQNWENVIEKIESLIAAGRKLTQDSTPPERLAQNQRLQFLSEAALQFRYFKDAWRNYACHFRTEYDPYHAASILTHVKEFMELLSSHLTEADA